MGAPSYGYVYLFKSGKYYKIGRSQNPLKRLLSFSSLPESAICLGVLRTLCMQKLEQQMHKKFAEKRVNGEWFLLNQHDIQEFLNHPMRHKHEIIPIRERC